MNAEPTSPISLNPLPLRAVQDPNTRSWISFRSLPHTPEAPNPSERAGRFLMKFGPEWRSKTCPVETWYGNQDRLAREGGSSTTFTVVQYRRENDAPYYHEFLVFILSDGSCYLVERTGGGSNPGAFFRSDGCESQDYIQWLPANGIPILDTISKVKFEVRFPIRLDIIDVLAICFSIQRHPHARRYTLRCFNCYFMCYAVLSILTRRHASWNCAVLENQRTEFLQACLRRMDERSRLQSPEAKAYTFLRACRAFRPADNQPAQDLINALSDNTVAVFGAYHNFKEMLLETMWWRDLEPNMSRCLNEINKDIVGVLCQQVCGSVALEEDVVSVNTITNWNFIRVFSLRPSAYGRKRLLYHLKSSTVVHNGSIQVATEGSILPSKRKLVTSLCEPAFGAYMLLWWIVCITRDPSLNELKAFSSSHITIFGPRVAPRFIQSQIFAVFPYNGPITRAIGLTESERRGLIEDIIMTSMISQPDGRELRPAEEVLLWRSMDINSSQRCWAFSIQEFIKDELVSAARSEITRSRVQVLVEKEPPRSLDVFEFQKKIVHHVESNTARMERRGLGVRELLIEDIMSTISEIWVSMRDMWGNIPAGDAQV